MTNNDLLVMWTVYRHPADYPGKIVARKFEIQRRGATIATDDVLIEDTLEQVRRKLAQRGLTPLTRSPGDEPQIVETWL